MNSEIPTSAVPFADVIPPDLTADTQAVIDKLMTGVPLAPETYRRIRERAALVRDQVARTHGRLDVGVPSIRALRDGDGE